MAIVPPRFPLSVFYDGACPVCSREIAHYLARDHAGRLIAVDISAADFDSTAFAIAPADFMRELHAIDALGTVYRGVAAFQAIWRAFPEAAGLRLLAAFVDLPVIDAVARGAYCAFARLRPRLPGRREPCAAGTCRIGHHHTSGQGEDG